MPQRKRTAFSLSWGILALAMSLIAFSRPADACLCPVAVDPGTEAQTAITTAESVVAEAADVAGWAADAAQFAKKILQWAITNLDHVLAILSDNLSKTANSLSTMYATQAVVDAQAMETQKKQVTKITMAYAMNLPTNPTGTLGKDTGYNACAMSADHVATTGDAIADLARALAYFTHLSKIGDGESVAVKRLEEQCFRGLRQNDHKLGVCPDVTTMTFGDAYTDADTKPSTILSPHSSGGHFYYQIPANIALDPTTGQISLPYVSVAPPYNPGAVFVTDPDEMNFVAAMMACINFQPALLPPPIVTGGGTLADAGNIVRYVDHMAGSSAIGEICAREIARRTRVSQTAAGNDQNGGVLEEVYQAALKRCQAQEDQGIFNPGFSDAATDFADCQTNGRSQLEMDYNQACKFKSPGYVTYLAGTGLTPNQVLNIKMQHDGDCNRFKDRLSAQISKITKMLTGSGEDPAYSVSSAASVPAPASRN